MIVHAVVEAIFSTASAAQAIDLQATKGVGVHVVSTSLHLRTRCACVICTHDGILQLQRVTCAVRGKQKKGSTYTDRLEGIGLNVRTIFLCLRRGQQVPHPELSCHH